MKKEFLEYPGRVIETILLAAITSIVTIAILEAAEYAYRCVRKNIRKEKRL